jgi:uncharacterized membrane protein
MKNIFKVFKFLNSKLIFSQMTSDAKKTQTKVMALEMICNLVVVYFFKKWNNLAPENSVFKFSYVEIIYFFIFFFQNTSYYKIVAESPNLMPSQEYSFSIRH